MGNSNKSTEHKESDNHEKWIEDAKENGEVIYEGYYTKPHYVYFHKVTEQDNSCPHLLKSKKVKQASKCPIYNAMKEKYQFSAEGLTHLNQYRHFKNEVQDKPACKYGDQCKTYIRCEQGQEQNDIDDKCHMKLYRHPPRTRQIKLTENIHSLVVGKSKRDDYTGYLPTNADRKDVGAKWDSKDVFLPKLIEEVIDNGYKYDLCMKCGKDDDCKHDMYNSEYSILKIVDEKMTCRRHIIMGSPLKGHKESMLALVLYTGGYCNYDLCASQRNGNYDKWKWFDRCLFDAINWLSFNETGTFTVYSGLNGVQMDTKRIPGGFFVTYVSTSWSKYIAKTFMKGKGMIIEIDRKYKGDKLIRCCDVSWISKFPDECEILFSRSEWFTNFECVVIDQSDGIQTVSLRKEK